MEWVLLLPEGPGQGGSWINAASPGCVLLGHSSQWDESGEFSPACLLGCLFQAALMDPPPLLLPSLCGDSPCPCVVSTACGCTSPGRHPHRLQKLPRGCAGTGLATAPFPAQSWGFTVPLLFGALSRLGAVPAPSSCLKAHCKCTIMRLFFSCCGVTTWDLAACVSPWPFSHGW